MRTTNWALDDRRFGYVADQLPGPRRIPKLLPKLFDRILIPEAVHRELQSDAAPDLIKRFLAEAHAAGVIPSNLTVATGINYRKAFSTSLFWPDGCQIVNRLVRSRSADS